MVQIVHHNVINKNPKDTYSHTIIDSASGCENLTQSILYLKNKPIILNKSTKSQKIGYVLNGKISLTIKNNISSKELILSKGFAFLIPEKIECEVANIAFDHSTLLIIKSPQTESHKLKKAKVEKQSEIVPHVDKKKQTNLPAGEDRYFKLLIDPEYGSKYVTQFLGFIKKIKAPFHEHTYEEVIFIIKGEGIIHYGEKQEKIKEGTSIYLPPGTMHRLENKHDTNELELLGVFCPAGSPADKNER
jgi:mannose-6-phosphate isomerase-like protein (cupin superfamily)